VTRPLKKKRERFLVEEAKRSLGKNWNLGQDREHPDFVVTEDEQQSGLEVCEIFVGPQGRAGSAMKAKESATQRAIDALRLEYESFANIPLIVKFVGNEEAIAPNNWATVVPALLAHDLPPKPTGYHFVYDTSTVDHTRSPLRVHVTKALRPEW
jgi:hypothetical protein